jgi:hypothetical protein
MDNGLVFVTRCTRFVIVSCLLVAAACEGGPSETCVGTAVTGIVVHVRDAVSLRNLDTLATVTISRAAAPFDSLTGQPWVASLVTNDKPGEYKVRVDVPGYASATRNVTVPAATTFCSTVISQSVSVDLTAGNE